jgi:hypothetical protein
MTITGVPIVEIIIAIVAGVAASAAGGAFGGFIIASRALGKELAALFGVFYGLLGAPLGLLVGFAVLALMR